MRSSSSNNGVIIIAFIVLVFLMLAAGLFVFQTESAPSDEVLTKEQVKAIVRDYINENPELILSSVQQLQSRKMKEEEEKSKQAIGQKKGELEDRKVSPVAGNPQGDVAVVEFFDYFCGYCKRSSLATAELLSEDKNIALILKEYPILGPASEKAAQVALAVYHVDKSKYIQFHDMLMGANDLTSEEMIIDKAVTLGINKEALKTMMAKPEIAEEISRNRALAQQIGVRGTPAFFINGQLIPGAVDKDTLKAKIAEARKGQ